MINSIISILKNLNNKLTKKSLKNYDYKVTKKVFNNLQSTDNITNDIYYLKCGNELLKCGSFYYNDTCNFLFYNEFGRKMIFEFLHPNLVQTSVHLYINGSMKSYYELKNNAETSSFLNINELKNMILLIETLTGIYICYKNKVRFIPGVQFIRINFNNPNKIVCREFIDNGNWHWQQEFSIFNNEIEFIKKTKDFSNYLPINSNKKRKQKNKMELFFSNQNYKAEVIAEKYFNDKKILKRISNEFNDDNTINYKVTLNLDDKYELGFANYLYSKCKGLSIYGIEVEVILDIITKSYSSQKYYAASAEEREYLKNECNRIKEKVKIEKNISENDVAQYLYDKYLYNVQNNYRFICQLLENNNIDYKTYRSFWNSTYSKIYHELVKSNTIKVKWKSEYKLYSMVKEEFKDAKFQYRCSWLGNQSLDIYISSKLIAIEYQGKQHYETVKLFGGEQGFEKRKKLDEKKRKLCKEHDIVLIEWKYYEPITQKNLLEKINKI